MSSEEDGSNGVWQQTGNNQCSVGFCALCDILRVHLNSLLVSTIDSQLVIPANNGSIRVSTHIFEKCFVYLLCFMGYTQTQCLLPLNYMRVTPSRLGGRGSINTFYTQYRELLTGTHLGLLEMRSRLVTALVVSSLHLTSRVNSTEQRGQYSVHSQSYSEGNSSLVVKTE